MPLDETYTIDSERKLKILAILWIAYGILRIVAAVWLISFSNTATVMFGALLNRVVNPFSMMSAFHFFYAVGIGMCIISGVLAIFAGFTLATSYRSGRILTILAAIFALSDIPLGITLGTFSLVALLPQRNRPEDRSITSERTSNLRVHPSTT